MTVRFFNEALTPLFHCTLYSRRNISFFQIVVDVVKVSAICVNEFKRFDNNMQWVCLKFIYLYDWNTIDKNRMIKEKININKLLLT